MFPTIKTENGIYNKPQSKIEAMAKLHLQHLNLNSGKKIQIKLSADGAQVGRRAKFLNFTFSFLQQYCNSSFVDGNYTLGIFDNVKEDYDSLKSSFKELFIELSQIKNISINNTSYDVEFFFAGDEKMLSLLLGVNAANAKTLCISCKCQAKDFYDTSKFWSISDINLGARTFEDACSNIGLNGQKHLPLIDFIPFCRFVFDLLHANLRISELLFESVFNELIILDHIGKTKKRQNDFIQFLIEN